MEINKSEVMQLRERIEDELTSMNVGFSGFAFTAKHLMITNKYNALGAFQEQLAQHVGEQEAKTFVCEAYMRLIE